MKLVQLLAKELKEWPEGVGKVMQDFDMEIRFFDLSGDQMTLLDFYIDELASDACDEIIFSGGGVEITKSQWQAEREKMNKPKWIRHRGGKCPVSDGVDVTYRLRGGYVGTVKSERLMWDHQKDESDLMAYYVEETKDQEVEEVKKTNFGTITYKLEIDATEATKEIDSLVAKWGQIESPLKWRDAIIHCQAIIEDCEREIERNVSLLDAEGLMMQKDSKKAMQYYQTDIDMSDWRNWKEGDVFEVVKRTDYFTVGNRYSVKYTANTDAPITAIDDDGDEFCLLMEEIKFIRRP